MPRGLHFNPNYRPRLEGVDLVDFEGMFGNKLEDEEENMT